MAATQVKIYDGGSSDPGVDWAADVMSRLLDMVGAFALAVVSLGAFLVRSLWAAAGGRDEDRL